MQDYCGDNLCQENEKAPDCSDCKPKIKIENLQYSLYKINDLISSKKIELRIEKYDIIQLGDRVVVYPSLDIYKGYSQQQCSNKNLMSLFKDDFSCLDNCSYIIDGDKKGKTYVYREEETQLENPLCIYFIFELKSYSNLSPYESESLAKWESPISSSPRD